MTLQSRPMRWTPKPAKQCDYTPRPRTPALRRDDGKARMVVQVPKKLPAVRNQALREAVRRPYAAWLALQNEVTA